MTAWGPLLALAVTVAAIALLLASPLAARIVDRPGDRSLHAHDMPRFGGIGLMAGALPMVYLFGDAGLRLVVAAAALLAIVSFVDDLRSLPVAVRLPCHLAAAAVAVAVAGVDASPGAIAFAALAFLAIAWMTNLFNFMDGADGLAGGMAAIGFGAFGVAALLAGDASMGNASFAIAAAALGFLAFNAPPARVFMGDAGSVPLGFLAGAMGWIGVARELWPWWFPPFVFSPFVVDATVTLARRAIAREPILRAHRSHYYQRLVLGGWTHRRLAAWAWALMALVAASALVALGRHAAVQGSIIFAWIAAYAVAMARIDRRHPRGPGGGHPQPPGTRR